CHRHHGGLAQQPAGHFAFRKCQPATAARSSGLVQGTSAAPQNIVLSNNGNAALHITSVALGGFNSNDFSLGTSNCSGTIAAGGSCNIPLTFSPLGSGIRSATLTFTDDAPNSPQVLTMNGSATPAVSIPAPAAASVTAGQTAQYNLT